MFYRNIKSQAVQINNNDFRCELALVKKSCDAKKETSLETNKLTWHDFC